MNARITIGSLELDLELERPATTRRTSPTIDQVHIELGADQLQIWSNTICGEIYTYDAGKADGRRFVSRHVAELPDLDAIFQYLASQWTAHRADMIGEFLATPVKAMEAAIAARDGSSVYFADAGGQIKIGWSRQVGTRLAQLQTGSASLISLLGTIPGGRSAERRIHEQFAHLRTHGEWFVAAPELLSFIRREVS